MSIFARSVRAPSGNSPARMRRNRSRFSSTLRSRYGELRPGSVSVPRYSRTSSAVRSQTKASPCADQLLARRGRTPRSSPRRGAGRATRSRASARRPGSPATYSGSSLAGLVSSKRRLQTPPNSRGDAEVQADRLGVADVQVAVGLGREAGADRRVLAAGEVLANDLADEVVLFRGGGGSGAGGVRRSGHAGYGRGRTASLAGGARRRSGHGRTGTIHAARTRSRPP